MDVFRQIFPALGSRLKPRGGSGPGRQPSGSVIDVDPQEREISALFASIDSYVALCESTNLGRLQRLMNEYFAACADSVEHEGGLIDKFVGDAAVKMFGARNLPTIMHIGPIGSRLNSSAGWRVFAPDGRKSLRTIGRSDADKGASRALAECMELESNQPGATNGIRTNPTMVLVDSISAEIKLPNTGRLPTWPA